MFFTKVFKEDNRVLFKFYDFYDRVAPTNVHPPSPVSLEFHGHDWKNTMTLPCRFSEWLEI